jgi:hypothetical protein
MRVKAKLQGLHQKHASMVKAHPMPKAPDGTFTLPHFLQEDPMRASAASQNVLRYHSPEAHDDIKLVWKNNSRSEKGEAQELSRPSQPKGRNLVGVDSIRGWDSKLSAKDVDLMA